MSEKTIKVTDRRMFTADGALREEYRHLEEGAPTEARAAGQPSPAPLAEAARTPPPAAPAPAADAGAAPSATPPAEEPVEPGAPGIYDLVGMLAESASIYLQQARVVDGQTLQHLELARLHVQLLEVLKRKTAGNLDVQERAYLDSALYQLRMAYVEVAG